MGIVFSGKGDKYPDVTPAHALLAWAENFGKQLDLEEAIYHVSKNTLGFLFFQISPIFLVSKKIRKAINFDMIILHTNLRLSK